MNLWRILKFGFAMAFIFQYALITLALTGFITVIPFLPLLGIVIEPAFIMLGIFLHPICLAITFKLLAWIDEGTAEFGYKFGLRKTFVKARNSITKHLPRLLEWLVNIST